LVPGEIRKLAAILVAGADEERILAPLRDLRSDLIDLAIDAHHARHGVE
jgi:hypothetical protein